MTTSLYIGQAHFNLHILETTKLSSSSPKEKVMPKEALDLLNDNYNLNPSSFEQLRARSISLAIGVTLPFAILAIAGLAIYKTSQSDFVIQESAKLANTISTWANKTFTAIVNSASSMAATAGGVAIATFTLTRPEVTNALGSFFGALFGSLFGSSMGAGITGFFKVTENAGYQWWYDKYKFNERLKQIESNNASIIHFLTHTYNEMAEDLNKHLEGKNKENDGEYLKQLKNEASIIRERLPVIHAIFRENGIPQNQCHEITLNLSDAIGTVVSFGDD